jgi:hypothetical protein
VNFNLFGYFFIYYKLISSATKVPPKCMPLSSIDLLPPPSFKNSYYNEHANSPQTCSPTLLSLSKSPEGKLTSAKQNLNELISNNSKKFISSPKALNQRDQRAEKFSSPATNKSSSKFSNIPSFNRLN